MVKEFLPRWLRLLGDVLHHGGPGYLQFAITNVCNARCEFCGFGVDRFDPRKRARVTLQQARDAIDISARNQIGYLLFVGGEPLVHPDLAAMVKHAAEAGIHPMICSNGSLFTEEKIRELAAAGLRSVIISVDSHDFNLHETNRGLPGVCKKISQANAALKRHGIESTASVTVSRLIEDLDRLPDALVELGFTRCTFSYPLTALGSSYLSFSDSKLVAYSKEELIEWFERIKKLKTQTRITVANPGESLDEMQRHLRNEPEKFACLGGHKYFYLDWNLNLYRCHYWETPICSIYDFDQTKIIRDSCTRCMIDCYRDPSVLQYPAISLSDAWQNIRGGRLKKAAQCLTDGRNWTSLKELWNERKWIGRV